VKKGVRKKSKPKFNSGRKTETNDGIKSKEEARKRLMKESHKKVHFRFYMNSRSLSCGNINFDCQSFFTATKKVITHPL